MLIKTQPTFLFCFYIYNNISGIIMSVGWDVMVPHVKDNMPLGTQRTVLKLDFDEE